MDKQDLTDKLNAIRRTFLFCNSLDELAKETGIPSIVDNNNFNKIGEDRQIAVFRHFEEELERIADFYTASLTELLDEYKATSEFYSMEDLKRKTYLCTEESVLAIMESIYLNHSLPTADKKLAKFVGMIYDPDIDKLLIPGLNPAILVLLMTNIIPGYNSRNGKVTDINADYKKVTELMKKFGNHATLVGNRLKDEIEKKIRKGEIRLNRVGIIVLLDYYISNIDFCNNKRHELSEIYSYYNIDGLWVDVADTPTPSIFYNINYNGMTYNMEMSDISKIPIQYILFSVETLYNEYNNTIEFITTNPRGRTKAVLRKQIDILDYSLHTIELLDKNGMPNYKNPKIIRLSPIYLHNSYEFQAKELYKATEAQVSEYEKAIESRRCQDKYEKYKSEYDADTHILAITQNYIYVKAREPETVYRINKSKYDDRYISSVDIDSPAGIATIASESPYIGFEKIGLYIDVRDENSLSEKGVEKIHVDTKFLEMLE